LCVSANKAYVQANGKNIKGNSIKITFSDPARRGSVKGNELGYKLTEENCKTIKIQLAISAKVCDRQCIEKICSKYGSIKAVNIDKPFDQPALIHVEFSKPEEAKNAINGLLSAESEEKRKLIGDKDCSINYFFSKSRRFPEEIVKKSNFSNVPPPSYQNIILQQTPQPLINQPLQNLDILNQLPLLDQLKFCKFWK
jgi:hypothetical protein